MEFHLSKGEGARVCESATAATTAVVVLNAALVPETKSSRRVGISSTMKLPQRIHFPTILQYVGIHRCGRKREVPAPSGYGTGTDCYPCVCSK